MANEKIPLTYKGHPLRRKDNIIYYGDMPDLKGRDRVVKRSEKDSLYAAIDIASVWLDRALSAR